METSIVTVMPWTDMGSLSSLCLSPTSRRCADSNGKQACCSGRSPLRDAPFLDHWAVDKQVCCSRPVRMCLPVHCPSPALACHRRAAARRHRVAMLAVLCSLQHRSKILGAVFICGRPYTCAHVTKASLPHVPHARANGWGLPVRCLYRQCMMGLLQQSCTALHDNHHGSQLPCCQLVSAVALPPCLCGLLTPVACRPHVPQPQTAQSLLAEEAPAGPRDGACAWP
jgi:hypothetical protein